MIHLNTDELNNEPVMGIENNFDNNVKEIVLIEV
jgi:hypothetical protein